MATKKTKSTKSTQSSVKKVSSQKKVKAQKVVAKKQIKKTSSTNVKKTTKPKKATKPKTVKKSTMKEKTSTSSKSSVKKQSATKSKSTNSKATPITKKVSKKDQRLMAENEKRWQAYHNKYKSAEASTYQISKVYQEKTVIMHKKFGWGYILSVRNNRLEVIFKESVKQLASNHLGVS